MNDRLALATGAVCGVQDLLSESNYQDIKEELGRVNVLKQVHSNFYLSPNLSVIVMIMIIPTLTPA